jgi:hypothetical protein
MKIDFLPSPRISPLQLSLLTLAIACPAFALGSSPSTSAAASATTQATIPAESTAEDCLRLKLTVGQKFGNVFSKTVSYKDGGIDEDAGNIGGTDLYEVIDASPDQPKFLSTYRYDGRGGNSGVVQIRDTGQTDCSMKSGKCTPYFDDSGAIFDAFLWGKPTGRLAPGMTWKVELKVPWELGPPGTQTVTVMRVDPLNHEVMLKREGTGDGSFAGDPKQMTVKKAGKEYTVDVTPGTAHWIGYTVFREGLTVSDEMLVTRPLTVTSKDFGTSTINERQFTLLTQSPPDLL